MKLYRTTRGPVVERGEEYFLLDGLEWDLLVNRDDLADFLGQITTGGRPLGEGLESLEGSLQAPIGSQEVWAAGVTYYRSRDARMEEARDAGGGDFYDRVYDAPRPELFFKSTAHRVAGHGQPVRIRSDSRWNVPEPELTLVVTAQGSIVGYTVGNDMSSRDIEGENPLYLPQAKVYHGSCALGPGILVSSEPLPSETKIRVSIDRGGGVAFEGMATLSQMKRRPEELVEFLYREDSFPRGCLLMTGTGTVPPSDFTLAAGDRVSITIDAIGTLTNRVAG